MTHWKQVPYVSGAKELFAQMANDARTSNKRIAVFGDSQEDTVGESTCVDLSFYSWQKLGVCHESCIIPPYNHGTAAGTSLWWLSAGAATSDVAKVVPGSYIPPGQWVTGSGAYPSGCIRSLLAYKADTNKLASAGEYGIVNPSAGLVADIFLYTNSAGPAEIKWASAPVATGPSAGSIFAAINASAVTSGLLLNADSNSPKRVRTGTLPYDAAKPYSQLIYGGHNGSAYVAGAQMAGCRMISLAGAGGLVWEPMSVGGYTTESVAANHANAGPMFQMMGGPDGWSAIAIGLMNNNAATLNDTPEQYKAKLSAFITDRRAWAGASLPVLLMGDPPSTGVTGWSPGGLALFDQYAGVQSELANELIDVMAINKQRLMFDGGYDPANVIYSADGSHPTVLGANISASSVINAMFGGFNSYGSSGPTVSEIVAGINADITQSDAREAAATAASQSAPAAIRAALGLESANMSSLVNAVVGKQNVTDNEDGTFDIAVRNAADTATLVTIRYNPTTGVKTVV